MKRMVNSAVEIAAQKRLYASREVMRNASVSTAVWNSILFELGCDFVELYVKPVWLQKCLLQNAELNYWAWWIVLFMNDDIELLEHRMSNSNIYYTNKKMMLMSKYVYQQFEHYLKRANINELYEKV